MLIKPVYSEINTIEEFKEFLNLVNENTPRKVMDCHFEFAPPKYPYYVGLLPSGSYWTYDSNSYKYTLIPFKDLKKIIKKEQELEYEIC